MPVVACGECRHEQIIPGALAGLTVECEKCGAEFVANDKARPRSRKRKVEIEGVHVSPIGILKAAGLIVGILLGLGLVLFVIILIVRTPEPKPATVPVQKPTPVKLTPAEEESKREEAALKSEADRKSTAIVAILAVGVAVLAYIAFVVWCGAWVASDAFARGMSGLGWASFYFAFQAVCRVLVIPLALIQSLVIAKEIGLWVILAGEPLAWAGLVVYGLARRSGRIDRCGHCNQRRLSYLTTCPICAVPDREEPASPSK